MNTRNRSAADLRQLSQLLSIRGQNNRLKQRTNIFNDQKTLNQYVKLPILDKRFINRVISGLYLKKKNIV